jgi:hypothetical protein
MSLRRALVICSVGLALMGGSSYSKAEMVSLLPELKCYDHPTLLGRKSSDTFKDIVLPKVTLNVRLIRKPGNERSAPPTSKELTEETLDITQRFALADSFGLSKLRCIQSYQDR